VRLLRSLPILLIAISACKSGPKPRLCYPVPEVGVLDCFDKKKKRHYEVPFGESLGYRCKHIEDYRVYRLTCANKKKCVKDLDQTLCVSQLDGLVCQDNSDEDFLIPWEKSENHICTPEVDYNTDVSYCEAKC
jgi:hypothetical protein